MKALLFSTLTLLFLLTGSAHADVVINEIMQNPSAVADSDGEWFELYNTGADEVDLSGWSVSDDGTDSFTISSGTIQSYGYFLLGTNADPGMNGGVSLDYEYMTSMTLDDDADEIILYDDLGTLQDMVAYDGGSGFPEPDGASMALRDPFLDNSTGSSWDESMYPWPGSMGDFGSPGLDNRLTRDLRNWSFEEFGADGPEHWNFEIFSNISYTPNSQVMHHGDTSLQVTMDAFETAYTMSQTVANPGPGGFYEASAWVLDNTTRSMASVNVDLFNADGDLIGAYVGEHSVDSPDWQKIDVPIFVYDETVTIRYTLQFTANFQFGPSTFYVDEAVLAVDATVSEIQANPQLYTGSRVKSTGIVTQGTHTVHEDFCDGYIQDGDAGMMLFDPEPLAIPLLRGDSVSVIGRVDQVLGVTQFTDFVAEVTSAGNELPDPWLSSTSMFSAEVTREGIWSELTGEVTSPVGMMGESYSFMLDDGSGPAEIQIWADAGLDLDGVAVGDNLRLRGTMDVEQGLAQLQPSDAMDIEISPAGVDLMITSSAGDIPPGGGMTSYDLELMNNSGQSFNGLVAWRSVLAPNGELYGPFATQPFSMPAGFSVMVDDLSQMVPAGAPAGTYVVYHNIGLNVQQSRVWDQYSFVKNGSQAASDGALSNEDWIASGVSEAKAGQTVADAVDSNLPQEFALLPVMPNPFNAATTVRVTLPESGELTVAVYNLQGQQVTKLISGQVQAGNHRYTFDGSTLASGVYFVRAAVPGELSAVQKVTLLK
ncbi:lamin tail domain-containing protein [bacterium]|nr:lamin tail domain-containing protein [bacterium]